MRTAQMGDRVQVHYLKRFENGTVLSSRSGAPLDVTVGEDHPRLPGLGSALVGLPPGSRTKLTVPVELAYGPPDPRRVRRLPRARFPRHPALVVGKWVRVADRQGRPHRVRILDVREQSVVVDANHPGAGQAMVLEVFLVRIQDDGAGPM
jgi:FKBP-type peptidyl-prolyl cis-trans isomerase 2